MNKEIKKQKIKKSKKQEKIVSQLEEQNQDLENKLKRALADYHNLQVRFERDRVKLVEIIKEEVVLDYLPILDNLERASSSIEDEGLKFVIKQFNNVLKNQGLISIGEVGEDFDPHKHECIVVIDGQENKIVEVLEKGFQLGEKVIKAAKVKVGKKTI